MSNDWKLHRVERDLVAHQDDTRAVIKSAGELVVNGINWALGYHCTTIPKAVWQALVRDYLDRTREDPTKWAKELEEAP